MLLWNFTIDDASPFLSYSPYGDGPTTAGGWRTWYNGSNYISSPDQTGQGDSYHITSLKNANVTFQFFGTGITFLGNTNSSFNVIIDDAPSVIVNPLSSDQLMFSSQDLSNKLHTITLSAQPSNLTQSVAFDSAITSTPLDEDESSPSSAFHYSTDTTTFKYSGNWISQKQFGVPNATVTWPFYQTTQVNANVSFSFNGANAVAVKGLADSENGMYSVSLDGHTSVFNGTSLWTIPDALLFFRAGLDPNITHQLTIVNLSSRLCLNSITVFEHNLRDAAPSTPVDTTPHQSSSKGIEVIVGPVAGCLLLIVAIGLLLWFRRRHRSQRHSVNIGLESKLTSLISKNRSKTPPPHPSTVISPVLATLNQEDRSVTFDVRSTHTGRSSDMHSFAHLLKGAANSGHRSIHSTISNSVDGSHASGLVQDPSGGWESQRVVHYPPPQAQSDSSSSHHIGASLGSASQMSTGTQKSPRRLTIQTSDSFMSEPSSPRHRTHTPVIRRPSRGPLPAIPVPSYDAALRDPEPTQDEIREMVSLQLSESSRYRRRLSTFTTVTSVTSVTAPPQYEQ